MKIKKVKIIQDGLKGICVTYDQYEDVNTRSYETNYNVTKQYPIHLGLENKIKELRQYHADICGLTPGNLAENETKYIINSVDIIGLSIGNDWFLISAKVNTFADKKIAISTPKIDEKDEYYNYDKVQKLIGEILAETADYMSGAKKATDEEFGAKYIQSLMKKGKEFKDGDVTLDMFNDMTAEEKKNWCTKILEEEYGSMVSHNEDLIVDEENATVIELQKVG